MQATMISNAPALSPRLSLARRGYMVRSEKRPSPHPAPTPEHDGGKPPRRRPQKAGFFYKLLTTLLLVLIWPVGMVLLWRRKLHWSSLMKIFTSVITLMVCILLLGTALTIETRNPAISAAQDKVVNFLDGTLNKITDISIDLGERAELSMEALGDITEVYRDELLMRAADAIDWGVERAQAVRERFLGGKADLEEPSSAEFIDDEPEEAPSATAAIEQEPTERVRTDESTEPPADEAAGESGAATEPEAEAAPTDTPAPRLPSATSVPAAELRVDAERDELPVYIPASAPDPMDGGELTAGLLLRSGELTTEPLARSTAEPTPEPTPETTPEPLEFEVKPAGEATVYFNNSGKYYHTASSCGSMKSATAHRFAETANTSHRACNTCGAPDKTLLDVEHVVWVDAEGTAHLSDECAAFEGKWSLEAAAGAIEAEREGCPECRADQYLDALREDREITIIPVSTPEPTEAPTEEPTEEPTEAPTEEPAEEDSTDEASDEASIEEEIPVAPLAAGEANVSTEPQASAAPEASAEVSAAPEIAATSTKGPIVVTPRTTLKAQPEAQDTEDVTVYHTPNGKYYHLDKNCPGMSGARAYTVEESVAAGFARCPVCNPPAPAPEHVEGELLLWMDEQNVCHVSDECKSFQGQYTLIPREDALAQNLAGCARCGGADYLIPDTIMDPYVVGTPAPESTPEPEAEEDAA